MTGSLPGGEVSIATGIAAGQAGNGQPDQSSENRRIGRALLRRQEGGRQSSKEGTLLKNRAP